MSSLKFIFFKIVPKIGPMGKSWEGSVLMSLNPKENTET